MRNAVTNLLGIVGAAAVSVGVGMLLLPAGVIVAGIGVIALAWRLQS